MLFGHQNDDTNQSSPVSPVPSNVGVNPLAVDPATGASLPTAPPAPTFSPTTDSEPSILNQPTSELGATQPPLDTPSPFSTVTPPASEDTTPTVDAVTPSEEVVPISSEVTPDLAPTTDIPPTTAVDIPSDELLSLKQQALAELSPLVGHLDQTPEERFRTTMMMIQSTDNHTLIKDAYEAAQQISDEKARAQALLDVVNEINYFTQQKTAS